MMLPVLSYGLPPLKLTASGYMKHLKLYTETVERLIFCNGGKSMTIYEELIKRVEDGEPFYINFKNRALKIGKEFIVADGVYDDSRELIFSIKCTDIKPLLGIIDALYKDYKYSLPSERSDSKRRQYFKALPVDKLTDKQMATGERREIARAKLEGFILCMIVGGFFVWDEEEMGKWFFQSKRDPDLVILRSWIENN